MPRGLFHFANGRYGKTGGSVKLALNSKLIKKQTYRNRYQMPNMNEFVESVALPIKGDTNAPIWFSNIHLKYAYSQMKSSEGTTRQCNFSIVGGSITDTYRFKTGFYGSGDMPNEFQRELDSKLGHLPAVQVHLDDILIATIGSEELHWWEIKTVLHELNKNNAAVKWSKCIFLVKEIEWLGFRLSNRSTVPVERNIESIVNWKILPLIVH